MIQMLTVFSLFVAVVTSALLRLTMDEEPWEGLGLRFGGLLVWSAVGVAAATIRLAFPELLPAYLTDPGILALILFIAVGIADDFLELDWLTKLSGQLVCLIPIAVSLIEAASDSGSTLVLGFGAIACVWLLVTVNGVNLMDGVDGYAGMWSLLTIGWMLVTVGIDQVDSPIVGVAALVTGPLVLFVIYNRNPAHVILGDAGSLSLGFLTGLMAILLAVSRPDASRLVALMLVMTLPILEVFSTIFRRSVVGRSIFAADLDHLHHRILRHCGGNVRQAADLLACGHALVLLLAFVIDGQPAAVAVPLGMVAWAAVVILLLAVPSTRVARRAGFAPVTSPRAGAAEEA